MDAASGATAVNLPLARSQMAFTLGFHIVVACLGVGFPVLMLVAEGFAIRTGDSTWRELARRWSKSFAVLFAVGAVSGTVLSLELGLLWPGFMGTFGAVMGLPFMLEGVTFSRRSSSASTSTAGTGSRPAPTGGRACRSRSRASPRRGSS